MPGQSLSNLFTESTTTKTNMPRPKETTSRTSQSHASRSQAAQPEGHPSVNSQTRRDRNQRSNRHPETSVIGLVDDSRKLRSERSNPPGSSSANRRHDRSAPHSSSSSDHLRPSSKQSQDTPDLTLSDHSPSSAGPQTPEDYNFGADGIRPGSPQPDNSSSIYSLSNHAAFDSTLRCAVAPYPSTDFFSKHAHEDHTDNRSPAKSTSRSEHRAHFLEPSQPNGERPLTLREEVAASNDCRRARAIEQRISTFDLDPRTEALLPSAAATADESHLTCEQRIVAANQRRIARATEQRALGADRGPLRLMVPRQRKWGSKKRSNTLLNTSNTASSSWSGVGGAVRELEEREVMLAGGEILQPEVSVLGKRPRYVDKNADEYGQEGANYPANSMRSREVLSKQTRHHTTTEDPKAADTQVRMDKQGRSMVSESRRVHFDETKNQTFHFDEALFPAPYETPEVTKEEMVVTVHPPTNEAASSSSAKQRRQAQPNQTRRNTESHDEGFYETGPPSPVHSPTNEATPKSTKEKPKQRHATESRRHIGSSDEGFKEPGSTSLVHPPTNEATSKPTKSKREKGHLTQTRRDTGSRDEVLSVKESHLPVHQPTKEAKSKSKRWRKQQQSTQTRDEAFDEPGSLPPAEHNRAVDSKGKHSKARLLVETEKGPQELTKSILHKLTSEQRETLVQKYVRQFDSSTGVVTPEEARRSINALRAWNHLNWWLDSLGHWPLDASLHGPSMHGCTDISEQPTDANAPQDASVQALRDVMVGETMMGVEFEEYELCVPMQYSSEEAQAMFDFGLPENGTT